MARQEISELYTALLDSKFIFVDRGTKTIDEIYRTVKSRYSGLCDDSYLCSDNCKSGNVQPEWMHAVRRALQALKHPNGPVAYTGHSGSWEFL